MTSRNPDTQRLFRRVGRTAACIVLFGLAMGATLTAQEGETGSITLLWDSSPDPEVVGYRVYIGTESGVYSETVDVSAYQTSFVFTRASEPKPYYFAVASLAAGPIVGPRSPEVVGISGAAPAPASGVQTAVPTNHAGKSPALGANTSAGEQPQEVVVLAYGLGSVTAVTPTGDGRLLFIENGQRVRVLVGDALDPQPALEVHRASVRLTGLALDPAFAATRLVFVGESDTGHDGRRTLNIVRYRELEGALGEGATVVAGLPLPSLDVAPFTVGADRHIYVAVPHVRESNDRDPYAGALLRFTADGAAAGMNRTGSPVLFTGHGNPATVTTDVNDRHVWLAGGSVLNEMLAHVPAIGGRADGRAPLAEQMPFDPRDARGARLQIASLAMGGGTARDGWRVVITDGHGVYEGRLDPGAAAPRFAQVPIEAFGAPVAVAAGQAQEWYVVVRAVSLPAGSHTILKIAPQ